jgi:glycogen(starch) synthase
LSIRILHVLDHSWPVLDGYSNRSRSLIAAQKSLGWHPVVVTSPLHNLDDPQAQDLVLDFVNYYRVPSSSSWTWKAIYRRWPGLREFSVVNLLEKTLSRILAREKFDLIHAHSPALCGLAASRVAAAAGIPFVYEIRSFWEDGLPQKPTSLRYRLTRFLETRVAKRANAVVGIARPILKDLASRGVPEQKLFLVPNGVDVARFAPREYDRALSKELNLEDTPTLGFIGTFFPWEGVSWLVQATAALHARGVLSKLLIIGDGAEADAVRAAIQQEQAEGFVSYLGRVPHEDIERYYSILDVLVYPRRSSRITEMVTPLKPLEAMALGKAVLGSDVGGIRELIEPETTGLLFASGEIDDFCRQATRLLQDENLRSVMGKNARARVCAERDWATVTERYRKVYEFAMTTSLERR